MGYCHDIINKSSWSPHSLLVVVLEQVLDLLSPQKHLSLIVGQGLTGALHFLLVICCLCYNLGYGGNYAWNERRRNFLPCQSSPIHVAEPFMLLQLVDSIVTQTRVFVSLQQFVHEVHGLRTPTQRQLVFVDPRLVCKDLVPDLFSRISHVRPIAKHDFVDDDPKCKEICLKGVIHPADDFRSHVTRSSTGLL